MRGVYRACWRKCQKKPQTILMDHLTHSRCCDAENVRETAQSAFPHVTWACSGQNMTPKHLRTGLPFPKFTSIKKILLMRAISQRSRPSILVRLFFVRQMHGSGAIQPRIHILGIGNLGKLVAHALKKSAPQVPVTLLFHRPSLVPEWEKAGQKITRTVGCDHDDQTTGFDVEPLLLSHTASLNPTTEIRNLVVATKTHATTAALALIKQRLSPKCHIVFVQNGFGSCNLYFSRFVNVHNTDPPMLSSVRCAR